MDTIAEPTVPSESLHRLLTEHGHDIERACADLRSDTYADDRLALVAAWRLFEARMVGHMAAEEDLVLDAYAHDFPDDARLIRQQHDELRRMLTPLAIEVELHMIRADTIERLLTALRAHAMHEEAQLYPWAERHLAGAKRAELEARLTGSAGGVASAEPRP